MGTILEAVADTIPQRPAFAQGDETLSWDAFETSASRLAAAFASMGIGPGDACGVCLRNDPAHLMVVFALFKLGATPANVNYRFTAAEIDHVLHTACCHALVYAPEFAPTIAELTSDVLLVETGDGPVRLSGAFRFQDLLARNEPRPRQPHDGSSHYLFFTGGTTGRPKGVLYRHDRFADYLFSALQRTSGYPVPHSIDEIPGVVRANLALGRPVVVAAAPLMHGVGMFSGGLQPLLAGGQTVLPESRNFDADEIWRLVERHRATSVVIVGDAFARPLVDALARAELVGRNPDLSSLREIYSGGMAWSPKLKAQLQERTPATLSEILGSTEALGVASRLIAPGEPVDRVTFDMFAWAAVVDVAGDAVTPGSSTPGVIMSQTPAVGYLDDPVGTSETFFDRNGVVTCRTGDWAAVEPDGSIRLLGRGAQVINTGGEKVFAAEVEEALLQYPEVFFCAVRGAPHPVLGQQVVAVIQGSGTLRADDLASWMRGRLAAYKVPRQFLVVPSIRVGPNGKLDMAWIDRAIAMHLQGPATDAVPPAGTPHRPDPTSAPASRDRHVP